jgi:hypothetical protein
VKVWIFKGEIFDSPEGGSNSEPVARVEAQ